MKQPQVQRAINERLNEIGIDPGRILELMFEVATGDLSDFAPVLDEASLPAALRRAKALGISHQIRFIRMTKTGVELELYDAHKARELLGRRMGLWK